MLLCICYSKIASCFFVLVYFCLFYSLVNVWSLLQYLLSIRLLFHHYILAPWRKCASKVLLGFFFEKALKERHKAIGWILEFVVTLPQNLLHHRTFCDLLGGNCKVKTSKHNNVSVYNVISKAIHILRFDRCETEKQWGKFLAVLLFAKQIEWQ